MHVLGVEHGHDDRILDIFAGDEDPHVDPLLAHQLGDDGVEAVGEELVLESGAIAEGEDRGQGGGLRCGGRCGEG